MKKKHYFLIIGVFLFSTGMVVLLYLVAEGLTFAKNSFIRLFPPHPVIFVKGVDVRYNSWYFAGGNDQDVYLANVTSPLKMLKMDYHFKDTMSVYLKIDRSEKLDRRASRICIDSSNVLLLDGFSAKILTGNLQELQLRPYLDNQNFFMDAVPLKHGAFALRSLAAASQQYVLAKESVMTKNVEVFPKILEKQVDGLFCVDGMMHYEPNANRLVYLYYYRNQFLVMDDQLKLIYKGNTIDTNSMAKIKVGDIHSEGKRTLSAPPLIVNKNSDVYQNWLFVQSGLRAKNEDEEQFRSSSVIDVYNLAEKGKYQFSFYLDNYDGKKMNSFRVLQNKLIAVYDHYAVLYDLAPKYFKKVLALDH